MWETLSSCGTVWHSISQRRRHNSQRCDVRQCDEANVETNTTMWHIKCNNVATFDMSRLVFGIRSLDSLRKEVINIFAHQKKICNFPVREWSRAICIASCDWTPFCATPRIWVNSIDICRRIYRRRWHTLSEEWCVVWTVNLRGCELTVMWVSVSVYVSICVYVLRIGRLAQRMERKECGFQLFFIVILFLLLLHRDVFALLN